MKAFEYAAPRTEEEALEFLSAQRGKTEILAGGTDLMGLMKKMIITPERVVSLKQIESLKGIDADSTGARLGAMVTIEEFLDHEVSHRYPAARQAAEAIASLQIRSQGTLGGELCQRPQCWYFRAGGGLLADRGQAVVKGDNRFHAIFGNSGPAKFVSPSRIAPALIAVGASVRILGPEPGAQTVMPLEQFFRAPRDESQREHFLESNQLVTQILLPEPGRRASAAYEVQHGTGVDYPLVAAAASLELRGGIVRDARIVLGQVAPTPWLSQQAADAIIGRPVNESTASAAGDAAVSVATPLKDNEYKVQLARVAVKRALLKAAGLDIGGF